MEFNKRLRIQSNRINKHCRNMYGMITYLDSLLDDDLSKIIAKSNKEETLKEKEKLSSMTPDQKYGYISNLNILPNNLMAKLTFIYRRLTVVNDEYFFDELEELPSSTKSHSRYLFLRGLSKDMSDLGTNLVELMK